MSVYVTIRYNKQYIKMKKKKYSHFNNYRYHDALDPRLSCLTYSTVIAKAD